MPSISQSNRDLTTHQSRLSILECGYLLTIDQHSDHILNRDDFDCVPGTLGEARKSWGHFFPETVCRDLTRVSRMTSHFVSVFSQ